MTQQIDTAAPLNPHRSPHLANLRVFSYNIHKGFSGGKTFTLHQMRGELHDLQPDLLFLQEVLGHHRGYRTRIPNWPDVPQSEFLAHGLWPHYAYGKNAVYTKGHHGNAILSKYPILYYENIDISYNQLEQRGLLHTVIRLSEHLPLLHAICLHLNLLEKDRMLQLQVLANRIKNTVPAGDLLIIAGDFNDWRVRATTLLHTQLEVREVFQTLHGRHARTFPSAFPRLPLDRIYYRGFAPVSAKCLRHHPWNFLSDHAAIEADLKI